MKRIALLGLLAGTAEASSCGGERVELLPARGILPTQPLLRCTSETWAAGTYRSCRKADTSPSPSRRSRSMAFVASRRLSSSTCPGSQLEAVDAGVAKQFVPAHLNER